jgi:hypothetical protein
MKHTNNGDMWQTLIRGLTDFLVLLVPMVFSLCLVNSIISSTLTKVTAFP